MAKKRNVPLVIPEGVNKIDSEYGVNGRYTRADWVRFMADLPQKIGGYEVMNVGQNFFGIARGMLCWDDHQANHWHAVGTTEELDVFPEDATRVDITPVVASGTFGLDPFTTTNGSQFVQVTHVLHGRGVGDRLIISGSAAVGGITPNGDYAVSSVIDANNYMIHHSVPAAANAVGGGAAVTYAYLLPIGQVNLTTAVGYGIGTYGSGTYGTPRSASTTTVTFPRIWSLDNYGQNLLAMPSGWPLYEWDPTTPSTRAAQVTNAPTGVFQFVTSERMIVVMGAAGNPMDMAWCDDTNNTIWTPAATNTAGLRTMQSGSRLVAGAMLAEGVNLIWTDSSVYLMQFTGEQFIQYDTRLVGTKCGLIGPHAFQVVGGVAYWISGQDAFYYNGTVGRIPNFEDVRDFFFGNLDQVQAYKIPSGYNAGNTEIWWTYPSIDSSELEPDRYIAVNKESWHWIEGPLPVGKNRSEQWTAFAGRTSIENDLHAANLNGAIMHLEQGVDGAGKKLGWVLETGYVDIENGQQLLDIWKYWPDFQRRTGVIYVTLTSRDYPGDAEAEEVMTYTLLEGQSVLDLHHSGRQVKIKLEGGFQIGDDFRMGKPRLNISPAGEQW